MFKEIFKSTPAETYSSIALVIFFTIFVVVTVWVLTRTKKTVEHWSSLPLHDDPKDIVDDRTLPKPKS